MKKFGKILILLCIVISFCGYFYYVNASNKKIKFDNGYEKEFVDNDTKIIDKQSKVNNVNEVKSNEESNVTFNSDSSNTSSKSVNDKNSVEANVENKNSSINVVEEQDSFDDNFSIVEVDTNYEDVDIEINDNVSSIDSDEEIILESENEDEMGIVVEDIIEDNGGKIEDDISLEVDSLDKQVEDISNEENEVKDGDKISVETSVDNVVDSGNVEDTTINNEKKEESKKEEIIINDKMVTSKYVKLNKRIQYLAYNKSFQLVATVSNVSGKVKWTSSNTKVAVVDSSGKVTAKGGGLAIITATVNGESTACKVIGVRNTFKTLSGNYRTTATIYYDGNKKITYYFRRQNYNKACSSEKVNGKQICTSGFRTWYANNGCGTIATTAVVNAYLGNTSKNLISSAKMRMFYEKREYNWTSKYKDDPYCNKAGNLNQFTRDRVAAVLNNQFKLSATPYTISSTTGNSEHIERITNALAEGRPVIIFVNAKQAGTTKFTSGYHTLVMVGFADTKGNVLVLDSSHNGFREDTVDEMVNKYIGRGTGKYKGYIVLNKKKV